MNVGADDIPWPREEQARRSGAVIVLRQPHTATIAKCVRLQRDMDPHRHDSKMRSAPTKQVGADDIPVIDVPSLPAIS